MIEVLQSTRYVTERSEHVRIDGNALLRWTGTWADAGIQAPSWDRQVHFFDGTERTVGYFLVLDTLNYCFWPTPGRRRWEISHEAGRFSGYHALAAALKQALEAGVPLNRAAFLRGLSLGDLKRVLGGEGELQLMGERLRGVRELGRVLEKDYGGEAHRLVEAAGGSAVELARLLAARLESFRDVAFYRGRRISFYKRAQILAADLYGAFGGREWGAFRDVDRLTAFADYKLPQVLRHLGILRYSPALNERVDQGVPLEAGSPEEVEIRANTIHAVERIRRELEGLGRGLMSSELDGFLWTLGQNDRFRARPYHRTATIFY
ncbi:MAG: queuosine salvage family protein [Deltaproteobacteria bacterium]|nr:queuosine salvage family protein [Deltaproteobacteria bacterium]